MRRRKFIALLGAATFTGPLALRAQQRAMPVVGFLCSGIGDAYKNAMAAFRQGLKQTGYIEKQNVVIENAWANNEVEPVVSQRYSNRLNWLGDIRSCEACGRCESSSEFVASHRGWRNNGLLRVT